MPAPTTLALFDVDNTLLDNDRVIADLNERLAAVFGADSAAQYWRIFEAMRSETGFVDYLGALQRYRTVEPDLPGLFSVSSFLLDYPFEARVYPGAKAALAHLKPLGPPAILSDGDVVLQPRKIKRSGLWDAVDGRVLVYIHKEQMLQDLQQRYPADRYVMVDDKLRILTAMKAALGDRLTTVFVRQGHYAHDEAAVAALPPADRTIERIGDLTKLDPLSL